MLVTEFAKAFLRGRTILVHGNVVHLSKSFDFLKLFPFEFDPMKGHYPTETESGKSTFAEGDSVGLQCHICRKGIETTKVVIRSVRCSKVVGNDSYTATEDGKQFVEVRKNHGELQLFAVDPSKWEIKSEPTKWFHFVLTAEEVEANKGWAMASICPGRPATRTVSSCFPDAKEGDLIMVSSLPEGLRRRVNLK